MSPNWWPLGRRKEIEMSTVMANSKGIPVFFESDELLIPFHNVSRISMQVIQKRNCIFIYFVSGGDHVYMENSEDIKDFIGAYKKHIEQKAI